jgi:hypothetical protein
MWLEKVFQLTRDFSALPDDSARVLLHDGAGVSDAETWTGQIVAISIQRIGQPRFHNSPGWTCENRPEVSIARLFCSVAQKNQTYERYSARFR